MPQKLNAARSPGGRHVKVEIAAPGADSPTASERQESTPADRPGDDWTADFLERHGDGKAAEKPRGQRVRSPEPAE